jgi:probable HAF family extracellular repeat protein
MKMNTRSSTQHKLTLVLAISACLWATQQAQAADYHFYDLGTAGGPWSKAASINNAGQITGLNQRGTSTSSLGPILTIWNGTTMTTGENFSTGWAINSHGVLAGAHQDRNFWAFAATFNGTSRTELQDLGGRKDPLYSVARGINDNGQVVGFAKTADDSAIKPILWNNQTAPTVLNTLGGTTGFAWSINNAGWAVGDSFNTGDAESHATLWNVNNGAVSDLGTLGGTDSSALAINVGGLVVGWSDITGDSGSHATLWENGSLTDLGTLAGSNSRALGLNNTGQIVGWSQLADGSQHAAFWDGSALIDLNSYLDPSLISAGWILKEAAGINDHGWIVGSVINPSLGVVDGHAFLLTPTAVPVPGAVWLFGSAIAGLIGASHRKQRLLA